MKPQLSWLFASVYLDSVTCIGSAQCDLWLPIRSEGMLYTIILGGSVAARMRSKAVPAVLIRDMPLVVRNRHCIPTNDVRLYSFLIIIIVYAPFRCGFCRRFQVQRVLQSKPRADKLFSRKHDLNFYSFNSIYPSKSQTVRVYKLKLFLLQQLSPDCKSI